MLIFLDWLEEQGVDSKLFDELSYTPSDPKYYISLAFVWNHHCSRFGKTLDEFRALDVKWVSLVFKTPRESIAYKRESIDISNVIYK